MNIRIYMYIYIYIDIYIYISNMCSKYVQIYNIIGASKGSQQQGLNPNP